MFDYNEFALEKYLEREDKKKQLEDTIDEVLEEIERDFPGILPDDYEKCLDIAFDIITKKCTVSEYVLSNCL